MSETIRDRKLKFYTHLDGPSAHFRNENISAGGVSGVQRPLD